MKPYIRLISGHISGFHLCFSHHLFLKLKQMLYKNARQVVYEEVIYSDDKHVLENSNWRWCNDPCVRFWEYSYKFFCILELRHTKINGIKYRTMYNYHKEFTKWQVWEKLDTIFPVYEREYGIYLMLMIDRMLLYERIIHPRSLSGPAVSWSTKIAKIFYQTLYMSRERLSNLELKNLKSKLVYIKETRDLGKLIWQILFCIIISCRTILKYSNWNR